MGDSNVQTGVAGFDQLEHHLVAGGELLRRNRVDEARAEFAMALEANPDDAKALGLLGLACFRMSDFAAAAPVYEKLVSLLPEDASHRLNLGLVYLKLGRADDAIRELEQSRRLDPSQTRAVGYLGLAYARSGQYADAYQAFLRAGQSELATEMTQYLSEEERARIDELVAGRGAEVDELADSDMVEVAPPEQPEEPAVEAAMDERGAISRAVDEASPSASAAAAATRTAAGHRPPKPLSEFATSRLIRPEDGDHPFEISAGGVLIVRVDGQVYSRTEGVNVSGGELAYEVATRRERGHSTGEPFGADGRKLFMVSGRGHLIAAPLGEHFTAVMLDDDIFYLREELVFAFEERLRWENGHVPGSRATIPMVQFRGQGCVAFRTAEPLLAVKLAPEKVLYVDADILAGWIGRVVPRVVAPAAAKSESSLFVECTGEGVILVEEEIDEDADDADSLPPSAGEEAAEASGDRSP